MTYSVDLLKKVVDFVYNGGGQAEAARRFDVSLWCVRNWWARKDLRPRQQGVSAPAEAGPGPVARQVRAHPDATLREHPMDCGIDRSVIGKALKQMKITRKKRPSSTESAIWRSG